MIRIVFRLLVPVIGLLAGLALAQAQGYGQAYGQASTADLLLRIDQLQSQVRELTGAVEQLEYRNQRLEQALRKMQEDTDFRFQELSGKGVARAAPPPQSMPPQVPGPQSDPQAALQPAPQPAPQSQYQPPNQAPQYQAPPAQRPAVGGRRSDAFDPSQSPDAPGAPRPLGSMSSAAPEPPAGNEAAMGGPAGQAGGQGGDVGSPLDLSTVTVNSGGGLPPSQPRYPTANGAGMATLPPTQSPRDEYDLAYGYILHKDYGLAEQAFGAFLARYPNDRMAPDAQYWFGESLFQQQNYRGAADAFLNMSKRYEANPKSAGALLRLGQSLAALNEKELACATFGEITRKYPRASTAIRQAIERDQKRVHC